MQYCREKLVVDLYCAGNATRPRMDKLWHHIWPPNTLCADKKLLAPPPYEGCLDLFTILNLVADKGHVIELWQQRKYPGISTFQAPFFTKGYLWKACAGFSIPHGLTVYNDHTARIGQRTISHWSWLPAHEMDITHYVKVMSIQYQSSLL